MSLRAKSTRRMSQTSIAWMVRRLFTAAPGSTLAVGGRRRQRVAGGDAVVAAGLAAEVEAERSWNAKRPGRNVRVFSLQLGCTSEALSQARRSYSARRKPGLESGGGTEEGWKGRFRVLP